VDSLRKRLKFLESALETLEIPDVTLIHTRAEELKNARFDLVTARAVAALPKLIGWCGPLVKPGGYFVAMKGAELEDDEGMAAKLGLTFLRQLEITLPDAESSRRNLAVWVK
jgi:16S rRNA (guanine527-N7)-methyltransferase